LVRVEGASCAIAARDLTGNFGGQIGAFIMLILFGKLVDLTHSYNIPVIVIAIILFTGCLLWFLVDPRKQITAEENN
jgi:MFS-type transporter involved in bile tolerance (Atg22 family)